MISINQKKTNRQASFSNLDQIFSNFKKADFQIINEIVRNDNIWGGAARVSQGRIAKQAGVHITTLNKRTTKYQNEVGLMLKLPQHRHPSTFILNPQLLDYEFRKKWQKEIAAFRWLPVTLIQSVQISNEVFSKLSPLEYALPLKEAKAFLKKQAANSLRKETAYVESKLTNVSSWQNVANRKGESNKMSQSEIIISAKAASVAKALGMDEQQEIQLSRYDDKLIDKAYRKTQIAKARNPIAYLLRICVSETEEAANKPTIRRLETTDQRKAAAAADRRWQPIHPPLPWGSKSIAENHERYADWYEEHADKYAAYLNTTKEKITMKFMDRLRDLFKDPEAIERWRNNGVRYHDILNKYKPDEFKEPDTKETINGTMDDGLTKSDVNKSIEQPKNEPQSPISNENSLRSNIQHLLKKDSTQTVLVDSDMYEEVLD